MEVDEGTVAFAPLELGYLVECKMALHRPDPAALRKDDGDRLLLDHRRPVDLACRSDLFDARPSFVAELVLKSLEVFLEPPPLAARFGDELLELFALLCQRIALAADFQLLKLAQAAK